MKKILLRANLVIAGIALAYGLLYLYAYHYRDMDKISGYSAWSDIADEDLPKDSSLIGTLLRPSARYHQRQLAEESAVLLNGIWILEPSSEYASLVPPTLEFSNTSKNHITVKPGINSGGDQFFEFTVTRLISPDFPTHVLTGTSVSINIFHEDEIGLMTEGISPFELGAIYQRKK